MKGRAPGRGGNRLFLALAASICALAAFVASATADEASEAQTFGKDGIATPSLGSHFETTWYSSIEVHPDGGFLARRDVGGFEPYLDYLESYLPNGAPDPASPPQPVPTAHRLQVYPLANGKRLSVEDNKLTRVNPDGSLDPSFGGTGTVELPFWAQGAAELPSSDVLLAGVSMTPAGLHWVPPVLNIALVKPDGSIEGGGLKVSPPSGQSLGRVVAIEPGGDGTGLVVGEDFLLELRADGTPDPGFGSNGLVTGLPALVGGRVLADGSVEAVGSGPAPSPDDLIALRYTAAGAPDPSFGPEGIRTFDLGGAELALTALWADDGSVVVGGNSVEIGICHEEESCLETPVLIALDPAGGFARDFGDGGVLRLPSLAAPSRDLGRGVAELARRPDGSILAAGGAPPGRTVAFIAAVSPRGGLLAGFGEGGIVRVRQPVPATQRVSGFVGQADGELLAAATTDLGIADAPVLIRYAADGSLDRSFGEGNGYVALGGSGDSNALAKNGQGQVLVAVSGYPQSRLLLRDADGSPVQSFGSAGQIELPRGVQVKAVAFDAGRPVVVGLARRGSAERSVVLRFHPDGSPDAGFGHDGRVELRPGGRQLEALAIGSGGRILLAGIAGGRFTLGSLLPDGSLDSPFGLAGWAMPGAGGVPKAVALKRSGPRIYLAGSAGQRGRSHLSLLRYRADGALDKAFGHDGRRDAYLQGAANPQAVIPSHHSVLVALSTTATPLLSFDRDGRVRRQRLGGPNADNLRVIRVGHRLIIGWNQFSSQLHRAVYHLARRPLR